MESIIMMLTLLVIALSVISLSVVISFNKWFDALARNPDHSRQINVIGYILVAVIEPIVLVTGILLFMISNNGISIISKTISMIK